MSDNYGSILERWPVVQEDHRGKKIFLDTGEGCFVSKIEEEHFVSSDTLKGVKEKIDRALSFQEMAKKEKLDPIKVIRKVRGTFEDRDDFTLEDVAIVALHAGNGNPIIKTSKGKKEQISWSYGSFLTPMTPEERGEYRRLYKANQDADKAFKKFENKFQILDKVEEYARKIWKLPQEQR
jgi:hypothetical protein